MKKTTITTKTLNEMNEFFKQMNEAELTDFYTMITYDKKADMFMFGAFLDDREFKTIIQNCDDMNLYNLLREIISQVYDSEINILNRSIKGYNAFLRRKAKSLQLWSSRDNDIKVSGIVQEISEMNNKIEENKKEIYIWKDLVRLLFKCIDKFAKEEKIADKKAKVQKRIEQLQRVKEDDNCIFVG